MRGARLALPAALLLTLPCGGCQGAQVARAGSLAPSGPPLLVVDLDDTLAPSPAGALAALSPVPVGPAPLPGAARALRRLRPTHRLVYLTARPALLAPGTLRWLDRHGFPCAPVVFAAGPLPGEAAQRAYKARALARIPGAGVGGGWGVGDRRGDVFVYRSNGLRALLLVRCACDEDLRASQGGACATPDAVVCGWCDAWARIEARVASGR